MPPALRLMLTAGLAVALLGGGLRWFNAHLDSVEKPGVPASRPEAASAPSSPPVPQPQAPLASPDETRALGEGAPPDRWKALDVLEARRSSPELLSALDVALDDVNRHASDPAWWARDSFETRLMCLRGRLSGDDLVAFVSRRLPPGDPSSQSEEGRRSTCLVKALAASRDTSDDARDSLMPFVMSANAERRAAVHGALSRWTFAGLPQDVRDALFSPSDSRRRVALQAAFALGAMSYAPEIFARALVDEDNGVRYTAKALLCRDGSPAAARLIANAVLDRPNDQLLSQVRHDFTPASEIWTAFADIGGDESQPEETRARAIEIVGLNGELAHRTALEALAASSSDVVRASSQAALAEHQRRWR